MRSSVMRSFLSYWYKCAEDAKNGSLVSVFKEIQEEINIAPQKSLWTQESTPADGRAYESS